MIYESGAAYRGARRKAVAVFGMSGLGKTTVARMLRREGSWFHYSVDYRIGTRYMGELITDDFKRAAMQVPFLRELLLSDSVHIESKLTFENLAPLATYLGKPGDPAKGGIPFGEYVRRQREHREAEISAMFDTVRFMRRAENIYGYESFICDTSGSVCEVVDAEDPADPVLLRLSQHLLFVQISGTEADAEELARRFDADPKPMYYPEDFLHETWAAYTQAQGVAEDRVDPDAFIRWGFRRLLSHRLPRYAAIARRWGVSIPAAEIATVRAPADFDRLVAAALDARDAP